MRTRLFLCAALFGLMTLAACSQEPASKQEATEAKPANPSATTEPVPQIVKEADKVAEDASREVEKTASTVAETVKQGVEAAATEAAKVAEKTQKKANKAAEEAQQAAQDTVQTIEKTIDPIVPPVADGPQTVRYPASAGEVTFDHVGHAAHLECARCHTTDPPQKIAIDKTIAHALCTGCHKTHPGNAPTDCRGCHHKS